MERGHFVRDCSFSLNFVASKLTALSIGASQARSPIVLDVELAGVMQQTRITTRKTRVSTRPIHDGVVCHPWCMSSGLVRRQGA